MTKVTIPREVAEVIELLRKGGIGCPPRDNAYVCELWMRTGGSVPIATDVLRKIPFDTLLAALVNGYEREMTEEERIHANIRDLYVTYNSGNGHYTLQSEDYAYASGIKFALNTLGIVIPGINEGGAA